MEVLVKTVLLIGFLMAIIKSADVTETMFFPQECSWENATFWYPVTRQCEPLYQEGAGGCGAKRWLVLGNNELPKCVDMPCSTHEYVKVGGNRGTCRKIKETNGCPPGMQVVVLDNGDGDCDCIDGYVFYVRRDPVKRKNVSACYELFKRGPCAASQVLSLRPREQQAICRSNNNCTESQVNVIINSAGQVRLPMVPFMGTCKELNGLCFEDGSSISDGNAPRDRNDPRDRNAPQDSNARQDNNLRLMVNVTTNKLECVEFNVRLRVLIDAPLLNCTPGSRRDSQGRCRRSVS